MSVRSLLMAAAGGGPSGPPGFTWTARTLPSSANWVSVAYGNSVFVAIVGYPSTAGTKAASSPDGVTWTARTLPNGQWAAVTFGAGLFVAVGASCAVTSPNGITWTSRTIAGYPWSCVTYGGGQFVARDNGGVESTWSSDGITWAFNNGSALTVASPQVAYGNGAYVTVASNYALADRSTDGVNWTYNTIPSSGFSGIAYGNGLFVATQVNATGYITSPDGMTWTSRTLPATTPNPCYITFGAGIFFIGGAASRQTMTSPDGLAWAVHATAMPSAANWSAGAFGPTAAVVVSNANAAASSP
jgi:hypothetical protein